MNRVRITFSEVIHENLLTMQQLSGMKERCKFPHWRFGAKPPKIFSKMPSKCKKIVYSLIRHIFGLHVLRALRKSKSNSVKFSNR